MTARRALLAVLPTPDARHDYLVALTAEPAPGTRLHLRYVPDRHVLDPAALPAYAAALPAQGLEALAVAVLDDLNNELVPRWVEVTAERDAPLPHRVVIEDRQPMWDNPHLFARMARV